MPSGCWGASESGWMKDLQKDVPRNHLPFWSFFCPQAEKCMSIVLRNKPVTSGFSNKDTWHNFIRFWLRWIGNVPSLHWGQFQSRSGGTGGQERSWGRWKRAVWRASFVNSNTRKRASHGSYGILVLFKFARMEVSNGERIFGFVKVWDVYVLVGLKPNKQEFLWWLNLPSLTTSSCSRQSESQCRIRQVGSDIHLKNCHSWWDKFWISKQKTQLKFLSTASPHDRCLINVKINRENCMRFHSLVSLL